MTRSAVPRDKVVGLVVALACLAFSAIGLKVNEPPEFTYVDGVRGQTVRIEGAELTVDEVKVGTRLVRRGVVEAETTGMFVTVAATLAVLAAVLCALVGWETHSYAEERHQLRHAHGH